MKWRNPIAVMMLVSMLALLTLPSVAAAAETMVDETSPSSQRGHYTAPQLLVDALVVRPLLFATTLAGTGLFLVSLPFTAIDRSVSNAADVLIAEPGRWTFGPHLGTYLNRHPGY